MTEKKVSELTESEFQTLISRLAIANQIEMFGVSVTSSTSSLKEMEETINRLISKHKEFLKHEVKLRMGYID